MFWVSFSIDIRLWYLKLTGLVSMRRARRVPEVIRSTSFGRKLMNTTCYWYEGMFLFDVSFEKADVARLLTLPAYDCNW